MIVDIFIAIVASFIWVVSTIMSSFEFVVPDKFQDSMSYFFSKLSYLSGIINVPDILSAFGWFLSLTTAWFTIKLILWVIHFIPGIPHKSPSI